MVARINSLNLDQWVNCMIHCQSGSHGHGFFYYDNFESKLSTRAGGRVSNNLSRKWFLWYIPPIPDLLNSMYIRPFQSGNNAFDFIYRKCASENAQADAFICIPYFATFSDSNPESFTTVAIRNGGMWWQSSQAESSDWVSYRWINSTNRHSSPLYRIFMSMCRCDETKYCTS